MLLIDREGQSPKSRNTTYKQFTSVRSIIKGGTGLIVTFVQIKVNHYNNKMQLILKIKIRSCWDIAGSIAEIKRIKSA